MHGALIRRGGRQLVHLVVQVVIPRQVLDQIGLPACASLLERRDHFRFQINDVVRVARQREQEIALVFIEQRIALRPPALRSGRFLRLKRKNSEALELVRIAIHQFHHVLVMVLQFAGQQTAVDPRLALRFREGERAHCVAP
ncbi:hypothetical protein D3C87_1268670 [compost metagenome]